MTDIGKAMPRGAMFLAFNAVLVLFLTLFVVAPVLAHFASRGDDIAESAAQLARTAVFEGYGVLTLRGLVHYLCSHDQQHHRTDERHDRSDPRDV